MFRIRPAAERGQADYGWLRTAHTFSFNDYRDPAHTRFRALRVMNEDHVQPGQGFGMHGHRDMEIVTYVLNGELAHRDSLGHAETLRPGEFQRMTAGTGIQHSEFDPSVDQAVHLYQIWLLPEKTGLTPGYEQKQFALAERQGRWQLVASHTGRDNSLTIHQDVGVWLTELANGDAVEHELSAKRHAWLQVLRGKVNVSSANHNAVRLAAGDGLAVSEKPNLRVSADEPAELLLFDLA